MRPGCALLLFRDQQLLASLPPFAGGYDLRDRHAVESGTGRNSLLQDLKAVNPKPARRLDEGLKCFTEGTSCEADRQLSMTHALVTVRDLSSSAMSQA